MVLSLLAVAAIAAPAAQAVGPLPPALIGTNPSSSKASPANSTTPLIFGQAEVITAVVRSGVGGGFPVAAATKNPNFTIAIYSNATCTGVPVATGTSGQLEGAGIQVTVPPDSTTIFHATQTDPIEPENPSECSSPGLPYWESSTVVEPPNEEPPVGESPSNPPGPEGSTQPPAPHLRMVPGRRSNDSTPLVTGSAPGAATVKIFENAGCNGAPVASGSAAQLAAGLTVQVPENTTTSFYGVSVGAGGAQSACSAPVAYAEDSSPPHTRITMAPGVKTRNRSPVFRFADTTEDPPGTAFLCKVDRGRWKPCSAPLHLHRLRLSSYVVRVKGIDTAGNEEQGGAKRRFKVVRHP